MSAAAVSPGPPDSDERAAVLDAARRAEDAAVDLASGPAMTRTTRCSRSPTPSVRTQRVVAANAEDIERARAAGTAEALIDRLTLDRAAVGRDRRRRARRRRAARPGRRGRPRLDAAQRHRAAPGPGPARRGRDHLRGPPNVTVDAAALCLKCGNAVLLRGSASAYESNTALVAVLRDGGRRRPGCPPTRVQLVPGEDRESVRHLMRAARPGRRADPARRRRPDPDRRRGVDRARSSRPASATATSTSTPQPTSTMALAHPDQRQGPAAQRLQRGRDPPGPRGRRRRRSCRRRWPPSPTAGVTVHGDERVAARVDGSEDVVPPPTRTGTTEYLSLDIAAARRRLARRGRRAHPALVQSGTPRRSSPRRGGGPPVHPAGRRDDGHGERVDPVHRRRPVRLRRRDRHLHPEAARPRPDGPARADHHQVLVTGDGQIRG